MRTVFEAPNAVEAHMILHLLQQSGIEGRVDGEHLLGAMGELPAMGLVRVVVDESDVRRAKEVIADWESHQREVSGKEATPSRLNAASLTLGMAAGAILTIAGLWWFERSAGSEQGIDYDGDGILEEKYFYDSSRLILIEYDRNSDRKRDLFIEYGADGGPVRGQADEDFNGSFETQMGFERGEIVSYEVDVDGNASFDYRYSYLHGVVSEAVFRDPDTGTTVKRQYFKRGKLDRAQVDSDRDGVFDTEYHYDFYEEVDRASRIQ